MTCDYCKNEMSKGIPIDMITYNWMPVSLTVCPACGVAKETKPRKDMQSIDGDLVRVDGSAGIIPPPSTDYRDRVDRMAAAILAGYYANQDNDTPAVDTADDIAEVASMQVDAIDRMLKEREANP